ncbi:hypothetical protein LTR10_014997 [Elasticomyces elasticus]|nr:hypothetical protein LTR10_014997 [Elasticomyces elasticus]KAK4964574.1 hypothetical protein LTR42_012871 [Elasticomyces elasticus]
MYKSRCLGVAHAIDVPFVNLYLFVCELTITNLGPYLSTCITPDNTQRNSYSSYVNITAFTCHRSATAVSENSANKMAPATSSTTTPRRVSADPKKGLWSLEYLTLLHLLYTRFAFADPKNRSQHVTAIFKKVFKSDLLITHPPPNILKDRHIPDYYLSRNYTGRGSKFKEVEADPKSPEQQARVDQIMPLIRSAITGLGLQNAVSEMQVPAAEDDENGEEDGEAGEKMDGEEDRNDVEVGAGGDEKAEVDDDYEKGQSSHDTRLLQRGTKRKQSPNLAQTESASKRNRPAAASAVETAASERAERTEDELGEDGPASTNGGAQRRRVARSSNRRTTQSNRLQEAIADGGPGVIGTETNAAAAVASSVIGFPASTQVKQKSVKKASRARSSWNGPVMEQRNGKKSGLGNSGTVQYPIEVVEEVEDVLQLISADKTPDLLKMMQKAKLSGDLAKSSSVVGLSKHLYKIENPQATEADIAADWQETERQMFNQWTVQQLSSRSATGDHGINGQNLKTHQGKARSKDMSNIDLTSIPDSTSSTSSTMVDTLRQQSHIGAQSSKSFRDRHDSAISLTNTPYNSSSAKDAVGQRTSAQPLPTTPTYGPHVGKPTNALLLRPFYGPKPHTASSVGRAGVGVQSGGEATSAEGDELSTKPNSSGKKNDSSQALR